MDIVATAPIIGITYIHARDALQKLFLYASHKYKCSKGVLSDDEKLFVRDAMNRFEDMDHRRPLRRFSHSSLSPIWQQINAHMIRGSAISLCILDSKEQASVNRDHIYIPLNVFLAITKLLQINRTDLIPDFGKKMAKLPKDKFTTSFILPAAVVNLEHSAVPSPIASVAPCDAVESRTRKRIFDGDDGEISVSSTTCQSTDSSSTTSENPVWSNCFDYDIEQALIVNAVLPPMPKDAKQGRKRQKCA